MDFSFDKIERRQPIHSGRLTPKIVLNQVNADLVDSKMNGDVEGTNIELVKNTTHRHDSDYKPKVIKMETMSSSINSMSTLSCSDLLVRNEDNEETKQLKGLLLLHLDLIQQQQELLLKKDRVIASLQADKDTFKCCLDGMERRLSLVKSKTADTKDFKEDSSALFSPPVPFVSKQSNSRGNKRRISLEPRNLSKRFATAAANSQNDKLRIHHEQKRSNTPTKQSVPRKEQSQVAEARAIHRPRRIPTEKEQTSSRPHFITEPKDEIKPELKQIDSVGDDLILRTHTMYYSVPYREIEPPDEEVGDRIKNVLSVEVPTWRLNPVPNRYVIEGTENLEDEIFMKRHQKPETDEKRRKRWDLQRSREQALYERLKHGYRYVSKPGTVRERDDNIASFYPDPDDIGFIEVADQIPVTAFGHPIPDLSNIEFDVPWLESYKKEEKRKPTTGRGRRR